MSTPPRLAWLVTSSCKKLQGLQEDFNEIKYSIKMVEWIKIIMVQKILWKFLLRLMQLNTIKTLISGSIFKIYTMFKTVVAYSSTYEFRNCSSYQNVFKDNILKSYNLNSVKTREVNLNTIHLASHLRKSARGGNLPIFSYPFPT